MTAETEPANASQWPLAEWSTLKAQTTLISITGEPPPGCREDVLWNTYQSLEEHFGSAFFGPAVTRITMTDGTQYHYRVTATADGVAFDGPFDHPPPRIPS